MFEDMSSNNAIHGTVLERKRLENVGLNIGYREPALLERLFPLRGKVNSDSLRDGLSEPATEFHDLISLNQSSYQIAFQIRRFALVIRHSTHRFQPRLEAMLLD